MEKSQIEQQMREILYRRVAGANAATLQSDSLLALLGVDSLAFSWILADMEETFAIEMSGGDIMKLTTLERAVAYVAERTNG